MAFYMDEKHNTDMEFNEDNFAVDVPPSYPNRNNSYEDWVNIQTFQTRKEAIAFAMEHFGADKNGLISIISSF